jgi:hypothetical protein
VLTASVAVEGQLQRLDRNSMLGVRVDYQVDGKYLEATLFHGPYQGVDLYDGKRNATVPWGTEKQPDEVVRVPDLARFQLDLQAHAPTGWQGKAHITYIMQNAGVGTRARITLRAAES